MLTMKAAPSGCCMIDHTSSTTSRRGLGSWAAAAHTVSVQTIAAAGRSSGSSSRRSKTVTRASLPSRSSPSSDSRWRRLPVAKGLSSLARSGSPASLFLQIFVKIAEARSFAGPGVIARQGVVEGCAAGRAEALSHHDFDEASEAAYALEHLLGVALIDDERVHALARHAGGEHAASGGAGHVRVLALRVDDVGRSLPRHRPRNTPSLVAKDLPEPERASTAVFALRWVPSQGS